MPLTGLKVGLIGAGAMGGALATGLVKSGHITPDAVLVSDVDGRCLERLGATLGVRTLEENKRLVSEADVIILAVKPDMVAPVLAETGPLFRAGQTLVSIAAGTTLRTLEKQIPGTVPVVRVMPNTPCLVGAGASAYALGTHAGPRDAVRTQAIFASVGLALEVKESLLDAVTGLSGSGPAYVYMVIEALADGGVRMGLPREAAVMLAAQTVLGGARMVLESGEHPATLRDRVTTPGGTTAAGLFALEDRGLRAALSEAVSAATARARELSSR
ncbi:MAG: pyrroline-5-carboxylate reductase [Ammonifex sp.]|jgi:pyrroline-5-carboxylate reductase|nr:MAG: pyrroline-5-carboxylate reductase [Ammonifex sp.]